MSIKIESTQVFGWEAAIRGARNPMNSWEKSDTWFYDFSEEGCRYFYNMMSDDNVYDHCSDALEDKEEYLKRIEMEPSRLCPDLIGPNDHKLLTNLCKGGTEESKWRRMVHVQMDITAPLYWWKEFETYKVGTVCNSCSTMHKIQVKEFTLEDFSCEHLITEDEARELEGNNSEYMEEACLARNWKEDGTINLSDFIYPEDILRDTIQMLNICRELYLNSKDKRYWWQMIQLLPSSYNQRRTIDLNYEVLAKQYRERKNHKLDEWHQYCDWIREELPYSEFIIMEKLNAEIV